MRISTIGYSMKQGVKNIGRNKMFSIASIATMAACIFLFGLFYSIVLNFNYIVEKAEESVAITVFFDENATQAQKDEIGDTLADADGVLSVTYVSADEAWESFSETYFGGSEEAAEGFANDNPLATSDNYEVYLSDVSKQDDVVALAKSLPGVRPDDGETEGVYNDMARTREEAKESYKLNAKGKIIVALYALAVTVILALIIINTGVLASIKNGNNSLRAEISGLTAESEALAGRIETVSSDEYVINVAENEYNMIKGN